MQMYLKLLTNLARNLPKGLVIVFLMGIALPISAKVVGAEAVNEEQSSLQQAPTITVTGTVVANNGDPIAGATVVQPELAIADVTGADGSFSLSVPEGSTIMVSMMGYEEVTFTASSTPQRIELRDDAQILEDVVVVAFQTQKKVSVTAAVSTVQTKDLQQSSSASLSAALGGRLSGVTTMQRGGGQPGRDEAEIRLRGRTTTGDASPLIMVDGVPGRSLNYLSADEIESISVLKDASATAVFGVRGANGVIIVTTRRGSVGKTELSLNVEQRWAAFTQEVERTPALEFMRLRNEAVQNGGMPLRYTDIYFQKHANPLLGLDPSDPDYERKAEIRRHMYPDQDWYRMMVSRWQPSTRINMNITGGTEKVKYFLNVNYLHQGGVLNVEPESKTGTDSKEKMDRYSFRANLDYQVTKSFKAYLNIGTYIEQINMPSADLYGGGDTNWMMRDLLYQITTITPMTVGPYTLADITEGVEGGQLIHPVFLDRSPFEIMSWTGYRNEMRSNLQATLGGEWDLSKIVTEGLSIRGDVSFDSRATSAMQATRYMRLYTANVDIENDELSYGVQRPNESRLSLVKGVDSRYTINMQASVNYGRSFGKHTVGGLVTATREYYEIAQGSTVTLMPYNLIGTAARFTYDYDNRYLVEVNMGYNGSEQFAPGNRFGFFPAVSAGWVISNEEFMKNNKVITDLKLRASYGVTGNDKLGSDRFLYLDDISFSTDNNGVWGSSALGLGRTIRESKLGNPDIGWEIQKEYNIGVDARLFRDLTLTFDIFHKKRSDILISSGTIPYFQGLDMGVIPKMNLGEVSNRGFEIELGYNKSITKDLFVNFKGNFSVNKNKQVFSDEAQRDETYVYRYRSTGLPIGTNFGYQIDYSNGNGYFNTQEELDNYLSTTTYSFAQPRLGDFKYVDYNEDGVIDDKDQVPIRWSSVPGITWGATLNVNFKGFDVLLFFQGVGRYASHRAVEQNIVEWIKEGTFAPYHKNAWTKERYESGAKITHPALSTESTSNNRANNFFIMNRRYTRLKNAEFGYTLPKGTLNSLGISNLRVYLSGENLFTWTPQVATHIDPEVDDPIGYVQLKLLNVGLQLTF